MVYWSKRRFFNGLWTRLVHAERRPSRTWQNGSTTRWEHVIPIRWPIPSSQRLWGNSSGQSKVCSSCQWISMLMYYSEEG